MEWSVHFGTKGLANIVMFFSLLASQTFAQSTLQSTEALSPTDCVSVGLGEEWNFPQRATTTEDQSTTKSITHQATQFLQCTGFNPNIETGKEIVGILYEIKKSVGSTTGEILLLIAQPIS